MLATATLSWKVVALDQEEKYASLLFPTLFLSLPLYVDFFFFLHLRSHSNSIDVEPLHTKTDKQASNATDSFVCSNHVIAYQMTRQEENERKSPSVIECHTQNLPDLTEINSNIE